MNASRKAAHLGHYQRMSRLLTPLFQSRSRLLGGLRDAFMPLADRLGVAGDGGDRGVEVQRHAGLAAHRLEQRHEQRAPVEPQPEPARLDVGVAQIDQRLAAVAHDVEAVDARGALEDRRQEPQPRQHRLAGGLEADAGADRPRRGDPLVDRDPVAGPREEQRGGAAGGAGADDRDVERGVHRRQDRTDGRGPSRGGAV